VQSLELCTGLYTMAHPDPSLRLRMNDRWSPTEILDWRERRLAKSPGGEPTTER